MMGSLLDDIFCTVMRRQNCKQQQLECSEGTAQHVGDYHELVSDDEAIDGPGRGHHDCGCYEIEGERLGVPGGEDLDHAGQGSRAVQHGHAGTQQTCSIISDYRECEKSIIDWSVVYLLI